MSNPTPTPRCSGCHGTNLCLGTPKAPGDLLLGLLFKPAGNWLNVHQMTAAACLDCGVVTMLLVDKELADLRKSRGL